MNVEKLKLTQNIFQKSFCIRKNTGSKDISFNIPIEMGVTLKFQNGATFSWVHAEKLRGLNTKLGWFQLKKYVKNIIKEAISKSSI